MRDLLAQQFPTVLAKVRIDKTGKVVDVHIVRGSGSEAVDMPVYRRCGAGGSSRQPTRLGTRSKTCSSLPFTGDSCDVDLAERGRGR